MSVEVERIVLEDGKYEIQRLGGQLEALRNGEPWRDLIGDKLVNAMFNRIKHLEEANAEICASADQLRSAVNAGQYEDFVNHSKDLEQTLEKYKVEGDKS